MKRGWIIQATRLALALFTVQSAHTQNWLQTSAPTDAWFSVSCLGDASKLIALSGAKIPTFIYTSTNSGDTWQTNFGSGVWSAVGASVDGSKFVAMTSTYILASTNSGSTWISNNVPGGSCLAGSADGSKWIAAGGARVYTSTNFGATWITNGSLPNGNWSAVAVSTNGNKMVLAGFGTYNGSIYTSTDSGVTWRLTGAPNYGWECVASSADGDKLVALAGHTATYSGKVYTSANAGTNWTLRTAPDVAWSCIASSADGTTLLAGPRWDATATIKLPLYLSTNSGVTWLATSSPGRNWEGVAVSADGSKLYGAALNAGIHVGRFPTTLRITSLGSNVVISWPALASTADFRLQQNFLSGAANWFDATNPPVLTGGWRQVTLSPATNQAAYRLKLP